MTISPITLIIALLGAASLGAILCVLIYSLRKISSLKYEISSLKYELILRRIPTPPPLKSNACEHQKGLMYDVEKYMADHQFPEDDKKKVRDFLSHKQFEQAFLTDAHLHYIHKSGEYLVPRSYLGLKSDSSYMEEKEASWTI